MARPSTEFFLEAGALLFAVILIVIAIAFFVRGPQTECWRDTLGELDGITEPLTAGYGSCLGEQEFQVALGMRSSCMEGVIFTDFEGCFDVCNNLVKDVGVTDDNNINREDCADACWSCRNHEGCVIAVPRIPSAWQYWRVWDAWSTYQERSNIITVYPTGKYSFSVEGGNTLLPPEKGTQPLCLEFDRGGEGSTLYSVTPTMIGSLDQCEVTTCF